MVVGFRFTHAWTASQRNTPGLAKTGLDRGTGWCRKSTDGAIDTHEAVVDAAAEADLDSHGEFDAQYFFTVVERIAAEKYNDEWA
jgi:hypothetical protein